MSGVATFGPMVVVFVPFVKTLSRICGFCLIEPMQAITCIRM